MRKLFGAMVLAAGLLGIIVPILPGWLLVLAGLALLKGKRHTAQSC